MVALKWSFAFEQSDSVLLNSHLMCGLGLNSLLLLFNSIPVSSHRGRCSGWVLRNQDDRTRPAPVPGGCSATLYSHREDSCSIDNLEHFVVNN